MKAIGSVTSMQLGEAVSAIGTPLGERGLATPESSKVAAWLAKQAPADMDAAAVSRASSHGVTLKVKLDGGAVYDANGNMIDYRTYAVGAVANGTEAAKKAALADLRNFMLPAPVRQIEFWLAELSVIVARRADDEFGEELRITAYSSRLSRYPADIARHALLGIPHKFWPAWSELEAICNKLASHRQQMIAALERPPAPPEPERRPPTQAERDRIQALIDEMFPGQSQEDRTRAVDIALQGNCMTGPEAAQ